MAVDVGTIGSLKCEVNLNKILMEINDKHITKFVVRNLVIFRLGLKQLAYIPDKSFRHTISTKFHADAIARVLQKKLPPAVESHMCCCLMAYYRNVKDSHEDLRHDSGD